MKRGKSSQIEDLFELKRAQRTQSTILASQDQSDLCSTGPEKSASPTGRFKVTTERVALVILGALLAAALVTLICVCKLKQAIRGESDLPNLQRSKCNRKKICNRYANLDKRFHPSHIFLHFYFFKKRVRKRALSFRHMTSEIKNLTGEMSICL